MHLIQVYSDNTQPCLIGIANLNSLLIKGLSSLILINLDDAWSEVQLYSKYFYLVYQFRITRDSPATMDTCAKRPELFPNLAHISADLTPDSLYAPAEKFTIVAYM